jgi:transcriptional regulator with XRE-family HTH domain
MDNMERFRIKEILKEKGMKMQELADRLGIHRTNLSTSLSGNPTLSRLEEIASILEVNVADLFVSEKKDDVDEKLLNGYVEYGGVIYKLNELDDLEKLLKLIKEQ